MKTKSVRGGIALAAIASLILIVGCERALHKATPLPGWSQRNPSGGIVDPSEVSRHEYAATGPKSKSRDAAEWFVSSVRDEEVWFISRGTAPEHSEEMPGSGTLATHLAHRKKPVPL